MDVSQCTLAVCVLTLILVCVLLYRNTMEGFMGGTGMGAGTGNLGGYPDNETYGTLGGNLMGPGNGTGGRNKKEVVTGESYGNNHMGPGSMDGTGYSPSA